MNMSIQSEIEYKLTKALSPLHLEVINESSNHNVPEGSESHFKIIMVSEAFDGKMLIARHREVNKVLKDELEGKIHALALHTYTAKEWSEVSGNAPMSPPCLGGGK